MATPSTMLDLGTTAPDFSLPDPDGKIHSLSDFADSDALLVVFICNHCPYVVNIRQALAQFGREYISRGLAMVGISPNDVEKYPEDSPERMREVSRDVGFTFPYLYDESQEAALAYGAACTPDFFLYDRDRKLVYRGQFDDSRPGNGIKPTGSDLRAAVDALLEGRPVSDDQIPSIGCSIKWKPGNDPIQVQYPHVN